MNLPDILPGHGDLYNLVPVREDLIQPQVGQISGRVDVPGKSNILWPSFCTRKVLITSSRIIPLLEIFLKDYPLVTRILSCKV